MKDIAEDEACAWEWPDWPARRHRLHSGVDQEYGGAFWLSPPVAGSPLLVWIEFPGALMALGFPGRLTPVRVEAGSSCLSFSGRPTFLDPGWLQPEKTSGPLGFRTWVALSTRQVGTTGGVVRAPRIAPRHPWCCACTVILD